VKVTKFNPANVNIRKVRVGDLGQLCELEGKCFDYDQLSRRNFHWMITKAHSLFLVIEYKTKLIGYGLVLINSGTKLARLYSMCTLKEYQGHGLATQLIKELESGASDEDCAYLRLEVKKNNRGAIRLYEKLGYKKFTQKDDYYDDGQAALCFEKRVRVMKKKPRLDVPYYQQRTDFTCGPSCLMMAMKTFRPKFDMSITNELQIWREATTIFMTSGHGGCGPRGLALSAWKRGFNTQLYLSHTGTLFQDTVRSQHKKDVLDLVHADFDKKIKKAKIKIKKKRFGLKDIKNVLNRGGIPIVLISTYHFDNSRIPHWVAITAYDNEFIYFHDPDQSGPMEDIVSRLHVPISEEQFLKISHWGKAKMSAAVIVYK
jgi:ribosomal protein S18 acetylase RimI-like enzyme